MAGDTRAGRVSSGLLPGLLVVAAGLLAAWLLLTDDGRPDGGADPGSAPATIPAPAGVGADDAPAPVPAAPDAGPAVPLQAELPPTSEPAEPLAVLARPSPGRTDLELVVLDDAGAAVPHARIQVWDSTDDWPTAADRLLLADAQGRAQVAVTRRGGVLRAEREGLGRSGWLATAQLVFQARQDGRAVVVLRPAGVVAGRVLTFDGLPAAWASLRLGGDGAQALLDLPAPPVADDQGRFELELDGGLVLSLVAERDGLSSRPAQVVVQPGERVELELRLPGPWSLAGLVVGPDGQPLPGAPLTLWLDLPGGDLDAGRPPPGQPHREDLHADEQGRFEIDLPQLGAYLLQARAGDAGPPGAVVSTEVSAGLPHREVLLTVPEPSAIAGRLVDGAGQPLEGVSVQARPAHLHEPALFVYGPTIWGRWGQARGLTDDDGRFVLEPLHPAGRYIVFCRPEPERPERKLVLRDVPAGVDDLRLVASDEALRRVVLEGSVVSQVGGLPQDTILPTLLIRLDGRVLDTAQAPLRGADGWLHIEGLAPGYEYALRVDAPGLGAVEWPWFEARGPLHVFDSVLPPPARLDLELVDGAGAPLPWVDVTLRSTSQFPVPVRRLRTDQQGRLLLGDLDPGSWQVTVLRGDQLLHEESLELAGGLVTRLRWELP